MTPQTALEVTNTEKNIYESLALRGDISALNPQDKAAYLQKLCESLGLNPFTQPFIPLKLNGKEILYASRGATDQLSSINKLNREILKTERLEDVYIATCKVTSPDGRFEIATGAVTLGNLKGDALANALMKAETKAKRRATLSFCGLGFMDESELETVKDKIETENGFPVNPVARSLSDLVTAKQLGMIRAIAREIGIDADEECTKTLHCLTDELSVKAASSFIQHLQDLQQNGIVSEKLPLQIKPAKVEAVFSPGVQKEIDSLRGSVELWTSEMGKDVSKTLTAFDQLGTFELKTKAHDKPRAGNLDYKTSEIKDALATSGWEIEAIEKFLDEKHGISEGIDNAAPEQLDALYKDLLDSKMILKS